MPSPSHKDYLACRYFAGLDGLRCLSITAVVWHHCLPANSSGIATRGFLGVDLFFVLSGYLIVTLLLREKDRKGHISLKDFWLRRILRLVPAYYLALALLMLTYLVFKPNAPATAELLKSLPIYALYLSNWFSPQVPNLGPTWSLATEEQFYLVWPILEVLLSPLAMLIAWITALVLNQLVNVGVFADRLSHLEILQVRSRRSFSASVWRMSYIPAGVTTFFAAFLLFGLRPQSDYWSSSLSCLQHPPTFRARRDLACISPSPDGWRPSSCSRRPLSSAPSRTMHSNSSA